MSSPEARHIVVHLCRVSILIYSGHTSLVSLESYEFGFTSCSRSYGSHIPVGRYFRISSFEAFEFIAQFTVWEFHRHQRTLKVIEGTSFAAGLFPLLDEFIGPAGISISAIHGGGPNPSVTHLIQAHAVGPGRDHFFHFDSVAVLGGFEQGVCGVFAFPVAEHGVVGAYAAATTGLAELFPNGVAHAHGQARAVGRVAHGVHNVFDPRVAWPSARLHSE